MISRISKSIFNVNNYTKTKICLNLLLRSKESHIQENQISTFQICRLFSISLSDVHHNETRRKIYIELDYRTAYIKYNLAKGVMKIITMHIPKELEEKDVGKLLAQLLMFSIRRQFLNLQKNNKGTLFDKICCKAKDTLYTNLRYFASIDDVKHIIGQEFYIIVNSKKASLKYQLNSSQDVMKILSVHVPKEIEGRGLGKILTESAFKYVAENNLKMEIFCVYAAHYLQKYAPQYKKYLV